MSSSSPSSRGSTPPPHNVQPASTIDDGSGPVRRDGSGPVSAERFLAIHSNKLSVLFAICIGLEETMDDKTGGSKEEKRKQQTGRQQTQTKRVERKEMYRLAEGKSPTGEADVAFLFKRAKEIKKVVANATQKNSSSDASEQGNKWYGPLPYLRLIHCLLEDDIKDKWIHCNDPKSIQEIDARRSDVRGENVFEMIANRWNSTDFNPTTMVTTCHYDFSEEIDVGYAATSEFARAAPDKVKDRLSKMKAILSSIIENWERSGQGDGGRIDEDDEDEEDSSVDGVSTARKYEWGRSEGRQGAFDCRESFLGSNPSYLLYFWDVLDNNDLFNTTMNRLSDEVGASCANEVPSVIRTTGRASRGTSVNINDDMTSFMQGFKEILAETSKESTLADDRRHAEDKEIASRRHAEDKEIASRRHAEDKEAADRRHAENKEAADRRHAEDRKAADRRHVEDRKAADRRHAEEKEAATNRILLQDALEQKRYLKRRIDTLVDRARQIRSKICDFEEKNETKKKTVAEEELKDVENEIARCTEERGRLV
ncbi:hypothetical protein IV203_031263 [Nitzschia inconspicua]|uniref:Uncharacterized protein n=1 Tax=Nitzschia inconspicua TaxID=303405 RepID=A0A9K3LVE6_9STRA|nr:hypothetical protein IV203_031263 [Nitzschia inconspicua]